MRFHLLPALALLLLLTQCKKADLEPSKPEDQLPPVTQTGANTFGCFIDGQPFTPTPTFLETTYGLSYDQGYRGGTLQIKVQQYTGKAPVITHYLTLGGNNITKVGTYPFSLGGDKSVFYTDTSKEAPCKSFGNEKTATYLSGQLVITRFDLKQGIISGTFAFKLAQPGCDTLRITQGRFDKTL